MKLIKAILISITAVLLFILIVLFSIQIFDYAINVKTYSAIDKFFNKVNTITKNDKCMDNFGDVIKYNTLHNDPFPKDIKIHIHNTAGKFPFKPELYAQTILSCNQYKKDILAIDVPKNIPVDKQVLLNKYLKLNSESIDLLLYKLDKYKDSKKYMDKTDLLDTVPFQSFRVRSNMKLAEIQAQKRLSFQYYLVSIPMQHKIESLLKMTNEYQKRMELIQKSKNQPKK